MCVKWRAVCLGAVFLGSIHLAFAGLDASGVNRCHGRGGQCGSEAKGTCSGVYEQNPAPSHQCEWRHGKCRKSQASCSQKPSKYRSVN